MRRKSRVRAKENADGLWTVTWSSMWSSSSYHVQFVNGSPVLLTGAKRQPAGAKVAERLLPAALAAIEAARAAK